MFNPLTPDRLVGMLSALLRDSAGWQRPLQPFQAAQLMSASSIGKFLAAELDCGPAVVAEFETRLTAELDRAADLAGTGWGPAFRRAAEEVRGADGDTAVLGRILTGLLRRADAGDGTSDGDSESDSQAAGFAVFRGRLHGLLRELADREVAFLADAANRPSRRETH